MVAFTVPVVGFALSLISQLLAAGEAPLAAAPGERQHRTDKPQRRGVHELKDPAGWPEEPSSPAGALDAARFDEALIGMCREVAGAAGLADVARVIREISAERGADPFLLGAVAYRQSRCLPGLTATGGVGLLQIEPAMFAAGAPLPFPRADLAREALLDPAHNLRVGIALLDMWGTGHAARDLVSGSSPHRTPLAHLFWGDRVWGATAEDRALAARRRLLERYAAAAPRAATAIATPLAPVTTATLAATAMAAPAAPPQALAIVSPLEGAPRLGTSAPGADRDDGARAHRGLDVDAVTGEPVRAVADGVVQFAGVDLPGRVAARPLLPRQVKRWRGRNLGPGGFFVRIVHADGVRTGYFHLSALRVEAGQTVKAGDLIGAVGRSGVKLSGSHLHFEVHVNGELADPVSFMSPFVLPPDQTLTHELAMAEKRQRLARERRARRHARVVS